ncbi:MAG: diadenylate cyclase CdaA [Bacteroidales bacterium]|nr:diadenylate cyclase CdaA [Bacteroidales bacterium]
MFDFLNLSFVDILDILLVAVLIYQVYKLIKGTQAMSIFIAILLLYAARAVFDALNMQLLTHLIGAVLDVGLIALIVIFQPELRRFLIKIGTEVFSVPKKGDGWLRRFFGKYNPASKISPSALDEITSACYRMSESKTGALLVFKHNSSLESYVETGDTINAAVNRRLIENIFFKNSPLHDGAVIMTGENIIAARCTLPISENQNINPRYGMRHRSAVGITEVSDAEAVVVSEETGEISYVKDGEIKTLGSITELRIALENSYK